MHESASQLPAPRQFPYKLIMVIEHDQVIGTQLVQLLWQETPFQAILATSLLHVRHLLLHLTCDVFLLADDTFSLEDLERFSLLSAGVEPPALLNLTFLSEMYDRRSEADRKNLIKAVKLLLCVHNASPGTVLVGSFCPPGEQAESQRKRE